MEWLDSDSAWVFSYGSLMWDPGFEYEEKRICTLSGYRRDLCMYSYLMRGTRELPGLVMGLIEDANSDCIGIAYRIDHNHKSAVWKNLQIRENTPEICYDSVVKTIELSASQSLPQQSVNALVFLPISGHEQYAGSLTESQKLEILTCQKRRGKKGTSLEYLTNTIHDLQTYCNICDLSLLSLHQKAKTIQSSTNSA